MIYIPRFNRYMDLFFIDSLTMKGRHLRVIHLTLQLNN